MNPGTDFRITFTDGTTIDVDLTASILTVQQLIAAILAAANAVAPGRLSVGIDPDSLNSLLLNDAIDAGAIDLEVTALNGSLAAADLGLLDAGAGAVLSGQSISDLSADLRVTLGDGSRLDFDLTGVKTMDDLLELLNDEDPARLVAQITARGPVDLFDTSGGLGSFTATSINGSFAATDLGVTAVGVGRKITGTSIISGTLRLDGRFDNDVLTGGNGDDLIVVGGGNDIIVGGPGIDRIFAERDADITLTQHAAQLQLGRRRRHHQYRARDADGRREPEHDRRVGLHARRGDARRARGRRPAEGRRRGRLPDGRLRTRRPPRRRRREHGRRGRPAGDPHVDRREHRDARPRGGARRGRLDLAHRLGDGRPFRLTFKGQSTDAIAWNANVKEVESALTQLTSVDDGDLTVLKLIVGGPWIVIFYGQQGGKGPPGPHGDVDRSRRSGVVGVSATVIVHGTTILNLLTDIQRADLEGTIGPDLLDASGFTGGSVVLRGGPGNDALIGSSGADTLSGGSDSDEITGNAGNDAIDGGTEYDILIESRDVTSR